jgi:hypothetical protein
MSGTTAVPAARQASGTRLDVLYRQVREILEQARATAARSVNTAMVRAYWLIGREVVEEEQAGSARAGYGDELSLQHNHHQASLRRPDPPIVRGPAREDRRPWQSSLSG